VDEVFRTHFKYVWNSLRRLDVRTADLEDLTHDVFIIVHRKAHHYDPARPLKPWLFGIAANCASDYRRKASNRREQLRDDTEGTDESASAHDQLEAQQDRDLVLRGARVHRGVAPRGVRDARAGRHLHAGHRAGARDPAQHGLLPPAPGARRVHGGGAAAAPQAGGIMSEHDLPELDAELRALLAIESDPLDPPDGAFERVFERVGQTLLNPPPSDPTDGSDPTGGSDPGPGPSPSPGPTSAPGADAALTQAAVTTATATTAATVSLPTAAALAFVLGLGAGIVGTRVATPSPEVRVEERIVERVVEVPVRVVETVYVREDGGAGATGGGRHPANEPGRSDHRGWAHASWQPRPARRPRNRRRRHRQRGGRERTRP
jgi:RNA polymerase sigma factor (sigma-70 family)